MLLSDTATDGAIKFDRGAIYNVTNAYHLPHSARKMNSISIFDSVYHISEISLQPPSKVT